MADGAIGRRDGFEQRLAALWPLDGWRDITVLLAVSGGADSVSLLRAAESIRPIRSRGRLIVAHYNHTLRADESDHDQQFVVELCDRLGMPCITERFDGDWREFGVTEGVESAARSARYDFFRRTACQFGARLIATAHTADDQAETVLHRIMRGTGIAGLAGIPRTRELLPGIAMIRPMLELSRTDVISYLDRIGQSYRTDSSNADRQFTRNRIRKDLLPQLESDYQLPVADSIRRLSQLAGELQSLVNSQVDNLFDRVVIEQELGSPNESTEQGRAGQRIVLDRRHLADTARYVVRELMITVWQRAGWPLRDMTFRHWDRLADMLLDETGKTDSKQMFPGSVTVSVDAGRVELRRG